MKTYLEQDVLNAAKERIAICFDEFKHIVVSYSGGKDSTVLLELARQEAEKRGRDIYALFIDLEAQYQFTVEQVEQTMLGKKHIIPIWICLPLNLRNAVSVFQPHWCCWEPDVKWVRQIPHHDCVISDYSQMSFFRPKMEFEEFIMEFPKWFVSEHLKEPDATYASLVAIRADESLNRFRAVSQAYKKDRGGKKSAWSYQEEQVYWSTIIHPKTPNLVSLYPIYDWRVEDIWKFIFDSKIRYNAIYDMMQLSGVSFHEQRICQPYGDDQRKGLDLWHQCEPETWEQILDRVTGVNYGAIYASHKMLGYHRGLRLPEGHTWKSYTFFLLRTIPEVLRERYLANFSVFLEWWGRHGFENLETVFDDETQPLKESERRRLPSWRRLALAILKNDFSCKSLSIGAIKDVYEDVYKPVAEGKEVVVRKSVKPVYQYLREQYAIYETKGIDEVAVDFQIPQSQLKEKYKEL